MGEDQEYNWHLVRDNTQGIGTLTYVEEDGSYGALGHGISDTDTGELLDIAGGELYQAQIVSVLKGQREIRGDSRAILIMMTAKGSAPLTATRKRAYSVLWAMAACISFRLLPWRWATNRRWRQGKPRYWQSWKVR